MIYGLFSRLEQIMAAAGENCTRIRKYHHQPYHPYQQEIQDDVLDDSH